LGASTTEEEDVLLIGVFVMPSTAVSDGTGGGADSLRLKDEVHTIRLRSHAPQIGDCFWKVHADFDVRQGSHARRIVPPVGFAVEVEESASVETLQSVMNLNA
jgi:hypothetical protein